MSLINRQPRGLLAVLDAQTQGLAPPDFGNVVTPTFDLLEFYLVDKGIQFEQNIADVGLAAGTAYSLVTIPQGEVWYVKSVAVRAIQIDAGTTVSISPFAAIRGVGGNLGSGSPLVGGAVTFTTTQVVQYHPGALFVGGTSFGTLLNAFTGVPAVGWNFQTTVLCARLQA